MNDTSDPDSAQGDDDIRRELARANTGSSTAHDHAVLAQAAAVAQKISDRRQTAAATRSPRGRYLWLASAAAVLAVVLVVPVLWVENDDGLRQPDVLVLPVQDARLSAAPEQFEWPFVPGASDYRLVLRDAGAEVLWRSEPVDAQRLRLDTATRTLVEAGGTFIWTVEASTSSAVVELGPFQFTVAQ